MVWSLTEKLKVFESAFQWFNSCLDWSFGCSVMPKTSGGCPAASGTPADFRNVQDLPLYYTIIQCSDENSLNRALVALSSNFVMEEISSRSDISIEIYERITTGMSDSSKNCEILRAFAALARKVLK